MKLNDNDATVRADSIDVQTGSSSVGEIDLYEELKAFAELSPDEQLRLLDRPAKTTEQTEKQPAESVEEYPSYEPVLTRPAVEPAEAETLPAQTQMRSPEELPSVELVQAEAPIEPVVAVEATVPTTESDSLSQDSIPYVEPSEVSPREFEGPRPSDPLSGFSLTPDFVFTGALSRGVCLACGAESGADDLFCMSCGVFIDEIASTLPVKPTCAECQQGISVDEIFCPWCGSVLLSA